MKSKSLLVKAFVTAAAGLFMLDPLSASPKATPSFLNENTLWRPRENLIFYVNNVSGKDFKLNFTFRDLNIYTWYPSRAIIQVIAPDDSIILRQWMEDDGIINADNGKNFRYQDGIYDPFADYQFRQYHAMKSPNGYPPNKVRSPFLANPEKLPARTMSCYVPAKLKGIYRVFITGTWDQFISVESVPKMKAGIHPGTGPLALVGNTMQKSYFWYPAESQDLCIAITEEVPPFTAQITLRDDAGNVVKSVKASAFCTFMMPDIQKKNAVYQLEISGIKPGACLTIRGVPQILFPDAQSAKEFGACIYRDAAGKIFHNHSCTVLSDWAASLKPGDLETKVRLTPEQAKAEFEKNIPYSFILNALKMQDVDPKSPSYGRLNGNIPTKKVYLSNHGLLVKALTEPKDGKNPFYGDPAIVRRIFLVEYRSKAAMTPGLRCSEVPDEMIFKKPAEVKTFWDVNTRSNWYGLGGGAWAANSMVKVMPFAEKVIPANVIAADKQLYRLWAAGRFNMHAAEVCNQWGYNMKSMIGISKLIDDADLIPEMARQQDMVMTVGYMGRQNPELTPYDVKHGIADADVGINHAGYITEHWGFDGEYGCQQEFLWADMNELSPNPKTLEWFKKIVPLKTHMMVPRYPGAKNVFNQFCSPTDWNYRTRGMAHKMNVPRKFKFVEYMDLWDSTVKEKKKDWPALQKQDFIRDFGDKFYFVKQGDLYTQLYTGARMPLWYAWEMPVFHGDSLAFEGPHGMGYGGWGHENKPGLISGIHHTPTGAFWMCSNNSVMDTNTLWGRTVKPIFEHVNKNMEPDVFAACYGAARSDFDKEKKLYTIKEDVPYTPMKVESSLQFSQSRIHAKVTIIASENFKAKEMYYNIPYVADRYTPEAVLADRKFSVKDNSRILTGSHFGGASATEQGGRLSQKTFEAEEIDLLAPDGKGVAIDFDGKKTFRRLSPLKYRGEAPAIGAFAMVLPAEWKSGQKFTFEFDIFPTK